MKVGILTMYYRRNYGGVLQSYALLQVLKSMGCDVLVIDYKEGKSIKNYHFCYVLKYVWNRIVSRLKPKNNKMDAVCTKPLSTDVLSAFGQFKNDYLSYTQLVNNKTIHKVAEQFDAIVVGSDQIWNGLNQDQLVYFFDFRFSGVKIAYAPCSIYKEAPFYNKRKLNRLFHGFDAISVRDKTTAELVYNTSGINPLVVLDPTALYGFEEFTTPALRDDKYVFAYILGSEIRGGHKAVLSKIFKKFGTMRVVSIVVSDVSLESEKFADEVLYTASPKDWVNLLANAQCVYTDSFHGVMFSMKFHKPFVAYFKEASRSSRLIDLKNTYGLNNLVGHSDEVCFDEPLDYETIDTLMDENRRQAVAFLESSLKTK